MLTPSIRPGNSQTSIRTASNIRSQRTLPSRNMVLSQQETGDTIHFASKTRSIKKTVGEMPDGTVVTLEETIDFSSDGQPNARKGRFVFDDPDNKTKDGKGYIEYEAVSAPDAVDFQYIWNNSTKQGGIYLVSWHLTNDVQRKKFIATDVQNDDLFGLAEKYGMKADRKNKRIEAPFNAVKTLAKAKLLKAGWTLE